MRVKNAHATSHSRVAPEGRTAPHPRLSDIDTVVSTAWAFHRKAWKLG